MYLIIFFMIFFEASNVQAKSCEIYKSDGGEYSKQAIPENDRLSYFDKGKPLFNFKVQDQDSIGTCFANALTVAVKASHKDHPDISYLYAAMAKGPSSRVISTDKKISFEEGLSCDALYHMKKKGGACPAKYSLLENNPLQASLLRSLGRYIDFFSGHEPLEREYFAQNFESLVKKSLDLKERIHKKCIEDKRLGFIPRKEMDQIFRKIYFSDGNSKCNQKIKELLRSFYTPSSSFSDDQADAELSEESEQMIRELFNSEELVKDFDDIFEKSKTKKIDISLDFNTDLLFKKIEEFIKKEISPDDCKKEELISFSSKEKQNISFEILSSKYKLSAFECEKIEKYEFLKSLKTKSFEFQDGISECRQDDLNLMTKDFFINFEELQKYFGLGILDQVTQANLNESNLLLQNVIMPDCQDKDNLISLDSLNCSSITPIISAMDVVCSPSNECKVEINKELVKKIFQDKVFSQLSKGNGIVVNVCTGFMINPQSPMSNFCRPSADGTSNFTFHAMSITGYTCVNGKIRYEILNSAGSTCPFATGNGAESTFYECQKDLSGNPTGKFWIDEDVLIENTTRLDLVN